MTKTYDGDYTNESGYVSDPDQKKQERNNKISNIQRLVDEGLASGVSDSSMDDILAKSKLNYISTKGKE